MVRRYVRIPDHLDEQVRRFMQEREVKTYNHALVQLIHRGINNNQLTKLTKIIEECREEKSQEGSDSQN